MTLVELAGEFARTWPQTLVYAPDRARRLTRVLEGLAREGAVEPVGLTAEAMLAWAARRSREVNRASLRKLAVQLAKFCAWMHREGYLLCDPFPKELLRIRPVSGTAVRVPTETEVAALFGRADASDGVLAIRNRALLELIYGCALRRSEAVGLDMSDWRGSELRILGKGGKERLVPVGDMAQQAVETYMRTARKDILVHTGSRETALFLGRCGNRLTSAGVWLMLNRQLHAGFGVHGLRRACATHMLRNGAPVLVLRDLLGHEKLSTTMVYTRVAEEDVHQMLAAFHPRN